MTLQAITSPMLSANIIVLDDDPAILTVLSRALGKAGYQVRTTTEVSEATAWIKSGGGDVVVTDVTMPSGNGLDALKEWQRLRPGLPVVVMSAHNMLLNAARAQELGARTFLPKPFDLEVLINSVGQALSQHTPPAAAQHDGVLRISSDVVLVGASEAMQDIYRTLTRLISNDLTVMITGESGTGKELVARALHLLGKRKAAPFVALNMAAIPKELMESALFGHEKGAFTGAHQRQMGAFERAQGGTLFLDEIGDMPLDAQTRLLRVLQQGEFSPVGSPRTIRTDSRIITATHHNLQERIALGAFREDLFYRLHVVPITMPALRDRREDIALLVQHFLARATTRNLTPCRFSSEAIQLLEQHHWAGNIRELENVIYRLCALYGGTSIDAGTLREQLNAKPSHTLPTETEPQSISTPGMEEDIRRHIRGYFDAHEGKLPAAGLYDRLLPHFEKPLLEMCLRACGGNQIKAAETLGINRNTLRKKLRDHGLDAKRLMRESSA